MQLIYAPCHIKKYAKQIQGENKFFSDGIYGEFTFAYEINCSCGGKEFVVYKNSEPKVTAFCTSCGNQIAKVVNKGNDKFNIAIILQYSDQFDFDDQRFDENDITWCQIFLYDIVNLQSVMIVDDETA